MAGQIRRTLTTWSVGVEHLNPSSSFSHVSFRPTDLGLLFGASPLLAVGFGSSQQLDTTTPDVPTRRSLTTLRSTCLNNSKTAHYCPVSSTSILFPVHVSRAQIHSKSPFSESCVARKPTRMLSLPPHTGRASTSLQPRLVKKSYLQQTTSLAT
jgi:hypothetical protein